MRSYRKLEFIDFESAIKVTPEDIEMLARARAIPVSPQAYLEFLEAFSERHPPTKDVPPNRAPFTLP